MKKALLALFLIPLFSFTSYGSHLMGGEITWDCLGSGQFVFNMKLYRDCNGVAAPSGSLFLTVHNHPTLTQIKVTLISKLDASPICNAGGPTITCAQAAGQPGWPTSATPVQGAVEEYLYQSSPITISGTPPANGWIITYDDCCRNAAVMNLADAGMGNLGFTLRAKMFAYNGKNTNPCYDSSPEFFDKPRMLLCTGYPFTFNHNAVDAELDSLHFAWAEPLDNFPFAGGCGQKFTATCPPILNFTPGFSHDNPLPGPAINPQNVAAALNPNTGEVKFTSFTQGNFVLVIEVSAYKCGTLVAQVYREIQVVVGVCPDISAGVPNHLPKVVPPFIHSGVPSYVDTVYAGDLVDFFLTCTDLDVNGSGAYQNLSITASGPEFDQGFTNSNGVCLLPPCATLTPPPALLSGQQTLTTEFKWQTSCNHLGTSGGITVGCVHYSDVYNFIIKSSDDFCPIPGTTLSTITIVVLPPPPLPPPALKCISTDVNGDVTLNWISPPDPKSRFHAFDIYYSQNHGGPYTVIDSVKNLAQTSYTHVNANANNSQAYYFIKVRSGCLDITPPSVSSDTLQAIHLTVLNSGTGYADLNWNATHVPSISTNSGNYLIYKEFPVGTWTLLSSTPATNYKDPVSVCSAFFSYRVEVSDASGCNSVSNVDGKLFHDILVPEIPLIDSVSVDGGGLATVSWAKDPSGDVKGYIIYHCLAGLCAPIDTVLGINAGSYNSSIDATAKSDSFRVAAFDSCGNTSPLSLTHNSIHLDVNLNICNNTNTLTWNPYVNWKAVVKTYLIYAGVNGGALNLIGSTTSTKFVHTPLVPLSNYCYKIEAVDETNTKTSSSNQVFLSVGVLQAPSFQYLRKASVNDDNSVLISAYVDIAANVTSYHILRSTSFGGPYETAGSVPFTGNPFISFTDNEAPVGDLSCYYKVVAVDSCGNNAFVSQHGRTIHAVATPNDNFTNTVTWNDYEIWLGGVRHYNIYRSVDGVTDPVPLTTIPFGQINTYTDDISNLYYTSGKFCYSIQAIEGPGDMYGFIETSFSNLGCADQKPLTFIPNAFHPGSEGANNVFTPFISFANAQAFSFDIYNRWGNHIFHSDNPAVGWDGTYKGHLAAEGLYVFFAKIKGTDGSDVERKGTITLIR